MYTKNDWGGRLSIGRKLLKRVPARVAFRGSRESKGEGT